MHARQCILVESVCVGARALYSGSKMHNVAVFVSEWVFICMCLLTVGSVPGPAHLLASPKSDIIETQ